MMLPSSACHRQAVQLLSMSKHLDYMPATWMQVPRDPPRDVPAPMLKAEGSRMHMILVRRGPETGLMLSAMEREAV